MARVGICLLVVALVAAMLGCGQVNGYALTLVTNPGGGGNATDLTDASPYAAATGVSIKAVANSGHRFVNWTAPAGTFGNATSRQTTFTMPAQNVTVTANFAMVAWDWYDLDAVRNNLTASYILMNDLDSATAGYEDLAGSTANEGKGWQPIGTDDDPFTGTFDGQGFEIRDLYINRPGEDLVGLFGTVDEIGVIANAGVVNATVTANLGVGSLVGYNRGIVRDSCSGGRVSGNSQVGGLVGANGGGAVSSSHSSSYTSGLSCAGGLVGANGYSGPGNVSDCYSTGIVIGSSFTGGLVGENGYSGPGNVSDCYSTGTVCGSNFAGGLVGANGNEGSTVSNSYSTGRVTGEGLGMNVGGLMGANRGGAVSSSHSTGRVTGYSYVGGLVGSNVYDGNVSNSYSTGFVSGLGVSAGGLVGENSGSVSDSFSIGYVSSSTNVGGLVGENGGAVSNSYSVGGVAGSLYVGGLVGLNSGGTVLNCYSTGSVLGNFELGGLVARNDGTVSSSFWDTETSGQNASAGGTGKNTTEMHDISTFSGAIWDIVAVANPSVRNLAYIWNIVDDVTYPFLSWQPV